MYLIFCLNAILTDFRPLFKSQNFHLFCVFVVGLIKQREGATLTGIYQAVRPKTGYHSLVKFLSRGGTPIGYAHHLLKLLQGWITGSTFNETREDRPDKIWSVIFSGTIAMQHESIEVSPWSSVWCIGITL